MFVPTKANNFGNAFANGEVVTQGIAEFCATVGHGTWVKDGVDQHMCPRCGHTEEMNVAEVSAHKLDCHCGNHHSIMSGQALVRCHCGSIYKVPELGYNETTTTKPLTDLEIRLHNQAMWKAMGKVSALTKLNDSYIKKLTS